MAIAVNVTEGGSIPIAIWVTHEQESVQDVTAQASVHPAKEEEQLTALIVIEKEKHKKNST